MTRPDGDEPAGDDERAGLLDAAEAQRSGDDARTAALRLLRREVAGAPVWAWVQLAVAVLGVSTAGTAFVLARDVPPFLLAGWRLQLVTLLLAPAAWREARAAPRRAAGCAPDATPRAPLSQWRVLPEAQRTRWRASRRKMAVSGVGLAFHFGLWVSATQHTSLPHALLLVSATPVALAVWALVQRVPLSRGELGGTAAAMLGMVILVSDAHSDTQVSLRGDLEALGAATVFAVYLTIGGELRGWMPLFLYAVPVNGVAATTLCSVGLIFEGAVPWGAGRRGIFGYLTDGRYAAVSIYLAIVPGIVGHTSFNAVLKYISPMIITLAITCEPLIGSLVGWAAHVTGAPGLRTYLGGLVLIASTMVVVAAEAKRKAAAPPAALILEAGAAGEGEVQMQAQAGDTQAGD